MTDYTFQRIIELDLGQMIFIFNQAVAVRSSGKVLFFKQEWNHFEKRFKWINYHTINVRGFLYFIKGNIRIQITTDKLIFFYIINAETLMPELENVMYNFMACNQMMVGSMRRYAVSYKQNERCFEIYTRKNMHNLRVCIDDQNLEGSKALEIVSSNLFLVSKIDQVLIYDSLTFRVCGRIPISLLTSVDREPNEIIGMNVSKCEDWLGIISGKNLVMNAQKQNQLFIFKKVYAKKKSDTDSFILEKRIMVKDIPLFN